MDGSVAGMERFWSYDGNRNGIWFKKKTFEPTGCVGLYILARSWTLVAVDSLVSGLIIIQPLGDNGVSFGLESLRAVKYKPIVERKTAIVNVLISWNFTDLNGPYRLWQTMKYFMYLTWDGNICKV